MADLIASLAGNRRGVVLIEHNIREVARICPRIYAQDNGRRLIDGPVDRVIASPEFRRAYLSGEAQAGSAFPVTWLVERLAELARHVEHLRDRSSQPEVWQRPASPPPR